MGLWIHRNRSCARIIHTNTSRIPSVSDSFLDISPLSVGRRFKPPTTRDACRIVLMGMIGIALYNITLNYGKQFASSSTASFVVNTAPIFTAILSSIFLNEQVTFRQAVGILIAFLGIGVIAIGEGHLAIPSS
ncbi:DMT family transporter [Dyadobacter sp. CY261]|uniref:DMT family transporter n=1 Tax=Dyadobacter sp. CY261 TaxID=2907203 RepID=UPI0038D4F2B6